MIIELLGPMAVGKSTIAPIVAERLGIADYMGQGFHGLDNQQLSRIELWSDRVLSLLRKPGLFVRALSLHGGPVKARFVFALNLCRRDRFVFMASHSASGIVASGPVHSIAQTGTWIEANLTTLISQVTKADVYVRLTADPAEVAKRFSTRTYIPQQYIDRHEDWVERYDRTVTAMLAEIRQPVVDVSADGAPEAVAEAIVRGLDRLNGLEYS